jgi:hypothetical protein
MQTNFRTPLLDASTLGNFYRHCEDSLVQFRTLFQRIRTLFLAKPEKRHEETELEAEGQALNIGAKPMSDRELAEAISSFVEKPISTSSTKREGDFNV